MGDYFCGDIIFYFSEDFLFSLLGEFYSDLDGDSSCRVW